MARTLLTSLVVLSLLGCGPRRVAPPSSSAAAPASGVPTAEWAPLGGAAERAPRGPTSFTVKRFPGGERFDIASERGSVVLLDV